MSLSQLEPGNITTPNFILFVFIMAQRYGEKVYSLRFGFHLAQKMPFISRFIGIISRFIDVMGRLFDVIARFIGVIARLIDVIARFIGVIARFIGVIARLIGGLGRIVLMCKWLIISAY